MDTQFTKPHARLGWLKAALELLVLSVVMVALLPVLALLFMLAMLRVRKSRLWKFRPSIQILGVQIWNTTMHDAVAHVLEVLSGEGQPQPVFFVNAACFNIAAKDPQYQAILNGPGSVLVDGIGVKLAGMLTEQPVRENVNGTDLFPYLCDALENCRIRGEDYGRVYLLGACEAAAQGTADWIREKYPDVHVVGARSGFYEPDEVEAVLQDIRQSKADLLFVAMGVPRQEHWIHQHFSQTGVRVALGVGGLFDFYSGRIPRAPLVLRKLGFEWLYRLLQEPRRMAKRYLIGNATFLWRIFRHGSEYPGLEIEPIESFGELEEEPVWMPEAAALPVERKPVEEKPVETVEEEKTEKPEMVEVG